jgi:hypothetical protein
VSAPTRPCTACRNHPALALDVPIVTLSVAACASLGVSPEMGELLDLCADCLKKAQAG